VLVSVNREDDTFVSWRPSKPQVENKLCYHATFFRLHADFRAVLAAGTFIWEIYSLKPSGIRLGIS